MSAELHVGWILWSSAIFYLFFYLFSHKLSATKLHWPSMDREPRDTKDPCWEPVVRIHTQRKTKQSLWDRQTLLFCTFCPSFVENLKKKQKNDENNLTLNLVVQSVLKNNKTVTNCVSSARCLVEHFKKSEPACAKLKEKQHQMGVPPLNVYSGCKYGCKYKYR